VAEERENLSARSSIDQHGSAKRTQKRSVSIIIMTRWVKEKEILPEETRNRCLENQRDKRAAASVLGETHKSIGRCLVHGRRKMGPRGESGRGGREKRR